jgi:hypothetical protein
MSCNSFNKVTSIREVIIVSLAAKRNVPALTRTIAPLRIRLNYVLHLDLILIHWAALLGMSLSQLMWLRGIQTTIVIHRVS